MKTVLDLSRRAWVRALRDFTIIGTWILADDRWRPCMVIMRTGDESSDHCIPCIVSVDSAWIWAPEIGDPRRAARTAVQFAEALRLPTDQSTLIRLALLIEDHLDDLMHIPPYSPDAANQAILPEVIAEVTIRGSDGSERAVELTDV